MAGRESDALGCSGGLARRAGDTLFIRTGGGEKTFVTDPTDAEQHVEYRYEGRIASRLHAIFVHGYESVGERLVDNEDGSEVSLPGPPVLSPDGNRLVAVSLSLDACESQSKIAIWPVREGGITAGAPEWTWTPKECGDQSEWGPDNPKWISPDTLELTRIDNISREAKRKDPPLEKYPHRQILLVRRDTAWVFAER